MSQLGDGTTVDRRLPVKVSGLAGITGVDAGAYHNVAVSSSGVVKAWGWNGVGQLGDGTLTDRGIAVTVATGTDVDRSVAVSAGVYHSLALTDHATVFAWGWNGVGTLGDGTTTSRFTPVEVPDLAGVVAIDAGGLHNLVVDDERRVWAWGWNAVGQVGDGTAEERHSPVRLDGLHGAAVLGAGLYHSLVTWLVSTEQAGFTGTGAVRGRVRRWPATGTPLARKLGVKEGMRVALVGAPTDFGPELDPLPDGVKVLRRLSGDVDLAMLFVTSRADLAKRFPKVAAALPPAGPLWVAWPKNRPASPPTSPRTRCGRCACRWAGWT